MLVPVVPIREQVTSDHQSINNLFSPATIIHRYLIMEQPNDNNVQEYRDPTLVRQHIWLSVEVVVNMEEINDIQ